MPDPTSFVKLLELVCEARESYSAQAQSIDQNQCKPMPIDNSLCHTLRSANQQSFVFGSVYGIDRLGHALVVGIQIGTMLNQRLANLNLDWRTR
jgi:hypothetical protein